MSGLENSSHSCQGGRSPQHSLQVPAGADKDHRVIAPKPTACSGVACRGERMQEDLSPASDKLCGSRSPSDHPRGDTSESSFTDDVLHSLLPHSVADD